MKPVEIRGFLTYGYWHCLRENTA